MTEIASVAVPRSPRPIANRPAPSDYFIVTTPPPASTSPAGSPSSSRSPSPVRTAKSPSKDKKQKKRRESGFQLPQARERSTTPPEVEQLSQIPDWEEGRSVIIAPLPKVAAPTPATLAPASAPTLARSKQAERTVLRTSAESSTKAKPTVVAASKARTVGGTAGIIVSGSKAGGHISNPAGWTEDSAVAAEQAVAPTATKAVLKTSREVTSVIRDRAESASESHLLRAVLCLPNRQLCRSSQTMPHWTRFQRARRHSWPVSRTMKAVACDERERASTTRSRT